MKKVEKLEMKLDTRAGVCTRSSSQQEALNKTHADRVHQVALGIQDFRWAVSISLAGNSATSKGCVYLGTGSLDVLFHLSKLQLAALKLLNVSLWNVDKISCPEHGKHTAEKFLFSSHSPSFANGFCVPLLDSEQAF
jgi:hypothetical protein